MNKLIQNFQKRLINFYQKLKEKTYLTLLVLRCSMNAFSYIFIIASNKTRKSLVSPSRKENETRNIHAQAK